MKPWQAGPPPPTEGLAFPSLDVAWSPPTKTAGDVETLADTLRDYSRIGLLLGPRLAESKATVAAQTLQQLAPVATLAGQAERHLDESVAWNALLARRSDAAVRPRYDFSQLEPRATLTPLANAEALLLIDDAELDPVQWNALEAHVIGSCQAPLEALALGQERALTTLDPFLNYADALLWQLYRVELETFLPGLVADLQPYRAARTEHSNDPERAEQQRCGHAYLEYLKNFTACTGGAGCDWAPRVFLQHGVQIGVAEPPVEVASSCPSRVGRDYVAEVRELAREATRVAVEAFHPTWMNLASRMGTLHEVHAAIEDVCTPRRRRFSADARARVRERLGAMGGALASPVGHDKDGHWRISDGSFHVAGLGPIRQLAQYDAGATSVATHIVGEARRLREFALTQSKCRTADALPLAVAVVDVAATRVAFAGYFFEEELWCGALGPAFVPVDEPRVAGPRD